MISVVFVMNQQELNYIRKKLIELKPVKGYLTEKIKLRERLINLTKIGIPKIKC